MHLCNAHIDPNFSDSSDEEKIVGGVKGWIFYGGPEGQSSGSVVRYQSLVHK